MCQVPAGEEQAAKRSPQSGPQVPALFPAMSEFSQRKERGVRAFGKRVVRPSWCVCFPQDVPGPLWCHEQRGAGKGRAVQPSRPSGPGPIHHERACLCEDAEMLRGPWNTDKSPAPGSGDPPALLPKGHLERGPRVSTGGRHARRQPLSGWGQVRRAWKQAGRTGSRSRRRPRIGSETGGLQPRGRGRPRGKGCEALGADVHPLGQGFRNRQGRCPLGASPSGPNASLGAQLPWT